jgi:Tol biopolymer transport system component
MAGTVPPGCARAATHRPTNDGQDGDILAGIAILLVAVVAIWLVRPASQPAPSAVSLTGYPRLQIQPAFSPHGKKVAFAWEGEKHENFDLYVKIVGAETPLRLTSTAWKTY